MLILPAAGSHQEELNKAADFALENRQAIDGKFAVYPTNVRDKMLKNGVDIHRKDGCQWRGELGELDQHLNVHKECPLTVAEKQEKEDGRPRRVFPVKLAMTDFEEMKRSDGEWYSRYVQWKSFTSLMIALTRLCLDKAHQCTSIELKPSDLSESLEDYMLLPVGEITAYLFD